MTKQAVRQNHTDCHTRAVKWLSNGTKCNFGVVQSLSLRPTNCYQKDIVPTNGCTKPFVGINLVKKGNVSP